MPTRTARGECKLELASLAIYCASHAPTSLAIAALGTVSFISRGITGSHDVGRSFTGGPFFEPARRNVAEFDLCGGGGA